MAEHFCKEHKTVWFKTQYGFGHPIIDGEGNPVLNENGKQKWCREPKEAEEKPAPKRDSGTNASIETQVAFKGIVELTIAGVLLINSPLYLAAMNWAMSKLGNWSSTGSPPEAEKPDTKEPMSTKEQRAKILSTYKERGYSDQLALSIMIRLFTVSESKLLTKSQASEFIKILESGKYLEELKGVKPADIPF